MKDTPKSCFFIGSRYAPPTVAPQLADAIARHISEYGVTYFTVGHYGLFDRMVCQALLAQKERHPHIHLQLLIPYHPADRPIQPPKGFDGTIYPPSMELVPKRFAISRANRFMIQSSEFLISWVNGAGHSRVYLDYAMRRAAQGLLHVENLNCDPNSDFTQ